jgi:hypothetical protein
MESWLRILPMKKLGQVASIKMEFLLLDNKIRYDLLFCVAQPSCLFLSLHLELNPNYTRHHSKVHAIASH